MGWFNEQIRQRKLTDDQVLEETFMKISDAVTGERLSKIFADNRIQTQSAIEEIVRYYHGKFVEPPEEMVNVNEQLEYICRPNGFMQRTVVLDDKWYENAIGAFLAVRKEDDSVVALLPYAIKGYYYLNEKGKKVRITPKNASEFEREAISFYKPLPLKKITAIDLLKYGFSTWTVFDQLLPIAVMLLITLIGILIPKLNHFLFKQVIDNGRISFLLSTVFFIICVEAVKMLVTGVRTLLSNKTDTKMNVAVEAAAMMRLLSLPPSFFKEYSSGELQSRVQYISSLCSNFMDIIFGTGITSLFSLVYVSQIFRYAPGLVVPALIIIAATIALSLITTFTQMRRTKLQMELMAKENGMNYAMINGIQKVKLTGAEKRAFARWGELYAQEAKLQYNPPLFLKLNSVLTMAISLIGTIVLYFVAIKTHVLPEDYIAFESAYGMVSGAFMAIADIATTIADIKPTMEMAKPILDAVPEIGEGKKYMTRISGAIELNNVSFRYTNDMPYVIDDLSLTIRSGQYVAIVGKTGCGKSTLMRLMLGFETPQTGAVYYDGNDLKNIDVKSIRRKIGTVMQDGKLFAGDIFSNITISAPWLTLDEAWEAAEMAGMADDIRSMPMGMNTLISEGSGGVSGGQRQRLMIARAIASKPKILMFDEATSALDNITQKKVSDSLEKLKCTRIVIAHRLSTIRHCDRIIYLDNGKIVEDGTYDELIQKKGAFADLVARQQIHPEGD